MDYSELLDWLYGLKWFGIRPGLDRITEAMEKMGNPQDSLKVVHVAGTNGKGSVCAMLSSILQKSNFTVGMFTSPHLVDFRERIQINGRKISESDALRIAELVRGTGVELTFFEFTTAMAFAYFAEKNVDFCVIEVGLGGRLDATNIIKNPAATAIASISLDHTDWLGATIDDIAYEKARIAKKGAPMFTYSDNGVIREVCEEHGAPYHFIGNKKETNMLGDFQKRNAGLAAAVAEHIGVPEDKIAQGLLDVKWPARLQYIERNVLLDCAHNPEGIKTIAQYVNSLNRKVVIVFGVMKNKNYEEMLASLPKHSALILTRPKIDRALDPAALKNICDNATVIEDVAAAYERAKSIAGNNLVLVCGSCYLAGELLAYKNKVQTHPIMFVQ